jgi:hypothetical protein
LGPETIDRGIQGSRAIGITLPKKRLPLTISFFGNSLDHKPSSGEMMLVHSRSY